MKFAILAAALAFATANQGLAGGSVTVDPAPAADTASAVSSDWSGPYVGLTYGRGSGRITNINYTYDVADGTLTGFLLGYNYQRRSVVLGAELSQSTGSGLMAVPGAGDNDFFEALHDVRARLGYVVGKALLYGSLGYTEADLTVENGLGEYTMTGMSYGVGIDYKVTDRVFVGVDYTRRNVTLDWYSQDDIEASLDVLSLRAGLRF